MDNGDGTVTDTHTALMWEEPSDHGSIHDRDNVSYRWAGSYGKIEGLDDACTNLCTVARYAACVPSPSAGSEK